MPGFGPFRKGAERRERVLRRRFEAVSSGIERRQRWRARRKRLLIFLAIAALFAAVVVEAFRRSEWPVLMTLRHIAAFPNCDAARAVGLAPSARGAPGYYRHLDADDDGIACEPFRRP